MSDIYNRKPKSSYSFGGLVIVLLIVGVVGAAGYMAIKYLSDPKVQARMAEQRFESEYHDDKSFGPFMVKLKAAFPEDYAGLKYNLMENSGAKITVTNDLISQFLGRFVKKHGKEVALAPSTNLKAMRQAQLATNLALQAESEHICAAAFMGNMQWDANYGVNATLAANKENIVLLEAARAGRDTPVKPRGPRSQADAKALVKALRDGGLPPELMDVLGDEEKLNAASAHDQCTLSVAISRALTTMPDEVADRYTASIFTELAGG